MVRTSVIVCAHNPRPDHLARTFAALRNQALPYDQWELLLVDNASEPALAPTYNISWHPNARHIREAELGIAAARRCGIAAAAADLITFVDSDNVLAEDYLSRALKISEEWPTLGSWGSGTIIPEYERRPPDHLSPYMSRLALRDNKKAYWSNVLSCIEAIPAGAGMCVRAKVAREYARLSVLGPIQLGGRKGGMLLGHEDYEISFVACNLGYGMGVFPELKMTHLIPKERVSDGYFIRLAEANEISEALLLYKWEGTSPPNPFSIKAILSIAKNVVLSGGFHRKFHLAIIRGKFAAWRACRPYQNTKTS
jgi:glycosyltransferase involved in cell wall biosynthesis